MMINPIDFIVFPKPSIMAGMTSGNGKVMIARIKEVMRMERKVLYFNTDVSNMISTMLDNKAEMVNIKLISKSVRYITKNKDIV